jgi:hypothetical protein
MDFLVKDIFERKLLEGARLAAGRQGISAPVQWLNFMEILDALDSLQKGELLITTGYQLDDRQRYHDFILRLKSRGVCAAAIQIGYYIHDIPQYILDDADHYGFPVIELPSNLTFSHIMHVLMENITAKQQEKNDTDLIALKTAAVRLVQGCPQEDFSEVRHGGRAFLFLVSAAAFGNISAEAALNFAVAKLKAYFSDKSAWFSTEVLGGRAICMASLKSPLMAGDISIDLLGLLTLASREDRINIWVGFAKLQQYGQAEQAFDHAYTSYAMLKNIGTKKGVSFFENLRLFEWFQHFYQKSNALSFAYDILKPLISYDYFHQGEYLQTLRVFFANECHISEAAEKLFIHRHTLKNRLNRVQELCNVDFEDYFTRLHFSIALMVYDYFLS